MAEVEITKSASAHGRGESTGTSTAEIAGERRVANRRRLPTRADYMETACGAAYADPLSVPRSALAAFVPEGIFVRQGTLRHGRHGCESL